MKPAAEFRGAGRAPDHVDLAPAKIAAYHSSAQDAVDPMIHKPWLQVNSEDIRKASGGGSDALVARNCRDNGAALVNQIGPKIRRPPIDENPACHVLAKPDPNKAVLLIMGSEIAFTEQDCQAIGFAHISGLESSRAGTRKNRTPKFSRKPSP